MSTSYLDAVRTGFPTVMAISNGDPYVYDNLEWTGGDAIPSQDDLDAWIKSETTTPGQNTSMQLTKYQFRQLFTLAERVAIDNSALNTSIPAAYKAILVTVLKDLELSEIVNLDLPAVISGVGLLQQLGLLTAERAAQVLANEPPPAAE